MSNSERLKMMRECRKRDEVLSHEYNQERKRYRNESELLREKERLIEDNILGFFGGVNPQGFREVEGKN